MHAPAQRRPYRLGLDLGTNSLGWFVVELEKKSDRFEPVKFGPGGVRIFPDGRDPQSKESNAADRRVARGMRKRRDRFLQRQRLLLKALVKHRLMPADRAAQKALETLDPYKQRRDALAETLHAHHIGRALFHLNQRRGFLSNRKTDRKPDSEKGAIKQAEDKLKADMKAAGNTPTIGAFFAARHLPEALVARQDAVRAELQRLGRDHLTGNPRKKAWAKARKRLFGDEVLGRSDVPEGVRARAIITGSKASYDFYPTRELVRREFEAIWERQAPDQPTMTEDARAHIAHIIFHQRPLKDAVVGKCTLDPAKGSIKDDPEGYRAPWSHPLAQRFRILSEARNLEVRESTGGPRRLTKDESDKVALALLGQKNVTFVGIRKLLKLSPNAKFNLESEKRDKLEGDQTAARLADPKGFGKTWRSFSLERQIEIADRLQETEDDDEIISWLIAECGLNETSATRVANTPLPDGHCRLGLRAIRKINPVLETELADDGISGIRLYDAARRADPNYDTAKGPDGVLSFTGYLPYYGEWLQDDVVGTADHSDPIEKRYGRFPNPTVHIGLGQVRRVVNELIRDYGAPTEISIEFTRALKMSKDERNELKAEQANNQRKNEKRKAKIREEFGENYDPTPGDLLKMRLWEELGASDSLDRECPYTGARIGIRRLLSAEVDIDHILPFALTWDDSAANKTICMRDANRYKKKQTPFEAFGHSRDGYDWEAIKARAALLPKNKRWRFDEDARTKFDEKGGFLARQLNETGWLARLAKKYLAAVTDPYQIWIVPGRLTSTIRGKWGLNSLLPDHNYPGVKEKDGSFAAAMDDLEFSGVKNRADHRHHAIDALVVALTDRSLLGRMANAYDDDRDKIEIPTPWDKDRFREDLEAALKKMIVSHKPDHGVQGQLQEDTAYGFVKEPAKDEEERKLGNLVYRKPIEGLNENEIDRIRDKTLRGIVRKHVDDEKAKGIALAGALHQLREPIVNRHIKNGLRHVRLLKSEKADYLVPIANRETGAPYKAYSAGENFCVEIFETSDGKWEGEAVRRFDANRKDKLGKPLHTARWRADIGDAKLVMRMHKGDLIRLEHEGETKIMVVHRLDAAARRFKLAAHNETGNLDRRHSIDNEIDPFRWLMASYGTLKKLGAEAVRVDELGRVWRKH